MKFPVSLSIVAAAFAIGSAVAQTPYAGMQTRSIKALSDQQIADLRSGRGMGLALAAELNGYPGPSHLLELADKIGLSDAQRNSARSMFEVKKAGRKFARPGEVQVRIGLPMNFTAGSDAAQITQDLQRAVESL